MYGTTNWKTSSVLHVETSLFKIQCLVTPGKRQGPVLALIKSTDKPLTLTRQFWAAELFSASREQSRPLTDLYVAQMAGTVPLATASPGLLQQMLTTEWYFSMKENNLICGRTWTQEVFGLRRRFKSGRLGQQRRAGGPKGTNKTKLRGRKPFELPASKRERRQGKKWGRKSRLFHCTGRDRKRTGFSGSDSGLHLLGCPEPLRKRSSSFGIRFVDHPSPLPGKR